MILSCVFLFSDSCSWVLCLSWTVKLSAVLQKSPSAPTNSLVFQHCCVFEPFPTMTVWFWYPSFHTEDNWGTWKKHALRARAWNILNRMKMCIFSLFCLNVFFYFLFSTALQKLQKIVTCFPEDKLSSIYPDLQIQKVVTPMYIYIYIYICMYVCVYICVCICCNMCVYVISSICTQSVWLWICRVQTL